MLPTHFHDVSGDVFTRRNFRIVKNSGKALPTSYFDPLIRVILVLYSVLFVVCSCISCRALTELLWYF